MSPNAAGKVHATFQKLAGQVPKPSVRPLSQNKAVRNQGQPYSQIAVYRHLTDAEEMVTLTLERALVVVLFVVLIVWLASQVF